MNVKIASACMVAAALFARFAAVAAANEVFEVSDVDELTNACAKATYNFNTIKLKPRVYDLTGIVMDRSGSNHLVVATWSGQLVGTGPRPEDTVIKGGGAADGCRILRFDKSYCTVSNLTFTGGYINQNGGSGGVANNGYTTFTDCVFSNNYAQNFGGALDQAKTLTRCKFIDNHSGNGGGAMRPYTVSGDPGVFRDCRFEGNHSKNGGVAYCGASWSNCVFVGNYSTGDAGCFSPQGNPNVCIDCHFTNNVSGGDYSVGKSVAAFTNCTFYGNSSGGSGMIDSCPSAYGCEVASNTGMPLIVSCTLRNCTVADSYGNKVNANPLVKDSVLYNCLVARNTGGNHSMSQIAAGATAAMYNCTVVSNAYYAQNYSVVGCAALVNTLLVGNYVASTGKMQDLASYSIGSYPGVLTNCLWTAQSEDSSYPFDQARFSGGGLVERAGFVDAAGGDFSLTRRSPARNAGWSDSAYLALVGPVDLAGGDRVYMNDPAPQIDVGCFECCLRAAGLVFIFR